MAGDASWVVTTGMRGVFFTPGPGNIAATLPEVNILAVLPDGSEMVPAFEELNEEEGGYGFVFDHPLPDGSVVYTDGTVLHTVSRPDSEATAPSAGAVVDAFESSIEDYTIKEAWTRNDGPPYGGVGAYLVPIAGGWHVSVNLAEFIREEPSEATFRSDMDKTLSGVRGVSRESEADREVWLVEGTPDGRDLVRAAASVVDEMLHVYDPASYLSHSRPMRAFPTYTWSNQTIGAGTRHSARGS